MRFKKTLAGIIIAGTVAVGADVHYVEVEWSGVSYSMMKFDTSNGDLNKGYYGVVNGRTYVNRYGYVEESIETIGLKEATYIGNKYVDKFKDGRFKEVTKEEYEMLRKSKRVPLLHKLSLPFADAAISMTASSSDISAGYANNVTIALNCTGTDRGILTFIGNRLTSDITSATYNGETMTVKNDVNFEYVAGMKVYAKTNSASGNHNISIDLSDYRLLSVFNVCYNGVDQTDMIEATSSADAYDTTISQSVTTLTDNAWVVTGYNSQIDHALTPDSGETEILDDSHTDANAGQIGSSYILRATAGSETMGWSWTGDDNGVIALLAIKPSVVATEAPPNNVIIFE